MTHHGHIFSHVPQARIISFFMVVLDLSGYMWLQVQPTLAGKKIADKNRSQENGVDK